MKLEIELDLNKIDYDAINKQIAEKIADMDLAANYDFKYKIDDRINEEVASCVSKFFRSSRWGDLTDSTRREMNDMLRDKAKSVLEPHVDNIISQIPEEEMNKIIADLIPKVLVDLLSSSLRSTLTSYFSEAHEVIVADAENRIRNYIRY